MAKMQGLRLMDNEGSTSDGAAKPVRGSVAIEDEQGLGDYLATIVAGRRLIAAVVAACVALAGAYLLLAAPTYRSDIVLQAEDKTKGLAGLDDLASAFSEKTPADTEIEILKSRSLLGSVVDQLDLTVSARPHAFPLIGAAMFRRYQGVSLAVPLFGLHKYAWGGERIHVARLLVPERLLDEPLRLVADENGSFELRDKDGSTLLTGQVGTEATGGQGDERTAILVTELKAGVGTQFDVVRRRRAAVVDELQTELRIAEKGKKTGIIGVSLDGKDAKQIGLILDAIGQTYVRQNVERKSAEAAKTFEFLQGQLPGQKKLVDTSEAALKSYQVKKGSADLETETQAMLGRAVEIETSLSQLEMERAELKQRFTDNHPTLIALREKESHLRAERAAMEAKIHRLPEQEAESMRLNRDAKVASELYFTMVNKAQEMDILRGGTVGNVRIIDAAVSPYEPVSPKKAPILALSLFLGLIGGIGAAFVRKALDQGVVDPAEIESTTGLPVYASIPHSEPEGNLSRVRKHSHDKPTLLAMAEPGDLAVESLRSLRTALQFALVEARNNVISISGPSPGVGKSFVTANLAVVLASGEKRVLLIDGDLRRGRLHGYFGGKRAGGVSEVVSGQMTFTDAVRKTINANLDFVSTGKVPPNPSELLNSGRFRTFLADVSQRYDLVVIDTPPILAVTDAAVIGRVAGVNVLALRAGKHPMREITTAVKHFVDAGAQLHGLVINDVSMEGGRFGAYQYHYQYAYRSETAED
jgi:tyrosine-protein kinase Etk/Wzc